jgi:hypothetical protein
MAFVRPGPQDSTYFAAFLRFGSAWLCLALCAGVSHQRLRAEGLHAGAAYVQQVVDDSRNRLSIPQEVRVSLVPKNALIVSVELQPGSETAFLLLFEEEFLEELTESEIRAVVAHELGHVWIFTHHPYLQTEQLANQIAMRLVSRESLEPVYAKVQKRLGESIDLARNLGDKP